MLTYVWKLFFVRIIEKFHYIQNSKKICGYLRDYVMSLAPLAYRQISALIDTVLVNITTNKVIV